MKKTCTKCGETKFIEDFYKHQGHKYGVGSQCKDCIKERSAQYRHNTSREKRLEWNRAYYQRNKEKLKAAVRAYQYTHKAECAERNREWGKNNKEKNRASWRRYDQKRLATLRGQLNSRMSYSIRRSLKDGKAGKSWELLVGFGFFELKERLKKTMPEGYTWQDFMDGKLHIDHKIPVSAFNFEKPEDIDFQRCWALNNLQLLPARENLRKSSKLTKPFQPSLQI